ncbi:hemerythrin domain-containing protein [Actinomadura sp. HBU206391]|nr:hemerythrin domain-containing protein [Actinomadura sp. HBU206391]
MQRRIRVNKRSEPADDMDVVDLLIHQHNEIRELFTEVKRSKGEARAEAFGRLRRLLAVHETAEEEIVHPNARRMAEDGDLIIDRRLAEENLSKRMLSELEHMGADSPEFPKRLQDLRQAVLDHAENEEREEFPAIREHASEQQLRVMATAVKAAEALAPTHPHPGVESTGANLLIGPYAAMMDRTRDAVRKVMKRS